jgi:hypothetical protein
MGQPSRTLRNSGPAGVKNRAASVHEKVALGALRLHTRIAVMLALVASVLLS